MKLVGVKHLPNLNGLRTIAAVLVVLQHSNHFPFVNHSPYYPTGRVHDFLFNEAAQAVQFFFVLSGFLITRIVLSQMEGQFRIGHFWLRRIARIWPVYFTVVAIAVVLSRVGGPIYQMQYNSWPLLLCFLENFDLMRVLHEHPNTQGFIVSVLWSVSIEEQFYFFYPILLMLIPRRYHGAFFGLVVIASGAFKLWVGVDSLEAELHTFSACYELGTGCLLAWLLHPREARRPAPNWMLLPYLLLLVSLWFSVRGAWVALLRPAVFAWIIYDQAYCPNSWLQTRFVPGLNALGKVTYGLYSYHMIVVVSIFHVLSTKGWEAQGPSQFTVYIGLILLVSIIISLVSYRWLEKPIMNRAPR